MRIFALLPYLIFVTACASGPSQSDIKPNPNFLFSDHMTGTLLESSNKSGKGQPISFVNMNTNAPSVVFGKSGVSSPMKKIFESDEIVVIQLVASGSGSVDTFLIEKKTGRFARSALGSIMNSLYASKGYGILQ